MNHQLCAWLLIRSGVLFRSGGGLASRIYSSVAPVIAFCLAAYLRLCCSPAGAPCQAVVAFHEAPSFLGLAAEGFGQASLIAGPAKVPLDVLAFLVVGVAATFGARSSVIAFDIPATEFGFFTG